MAEQDVRNDGLCSQKVRSALSPETALERGTRGWAASWNSKDRENTLLTHDMVTLTQHLERNTGTMIKKTESGQAYPFGVEGQAERGEESVLLHQQGKGCSSTFTLDQISRSRLVLPLLSSRSAPRAHPCPFSDQEEDGGVSQQSWTSQPVGPSKQSGGSLKIKLQNKPTH